MANASIIINQAGKPAGVAGDAREDLDLFGGANPVDFTNDDDVGVVSWQWTLVDRPNGSAAALAGAATPNATLNADVTGSYLVRLVTTDGSGNVYQDETIGAVVLANGWRIPAAYETTQFDPDRGWAEELDEILRDIAAGVALFIPLQNAYDDGPAIVTTLADGPIAFSRGATAPAADELLTITDADLAPGRTAALVTVVDSNTVGAGPPPTVSITRVAAGNALLVTGDAEVTGKLTVGGAIDPTSLSLATGAPANAFIDSDDGQNAGLSAAGHGRIKYNNATLQWEASVNGGAYAMLGGSTLQQAYGFGETIELSAARGAIEITKNVAVAGTEHALSISDADANPNRTTGALLYINDLNSGGAPNVALIHRTGTSGVLLRLENANAAVPNVAVQVGDNDGGTNTLGIWNTDGDMALGRSAMKSTERLVAENTVALVAQFVSSLAGAVMGPELRLNRDKGGVGAVNDILGELTYYGQDTTYSGSNPVKFAGVSAHIVVATAGSHTGELDVYTAVSGTDRKLFGIFGNDNVGYGTTFDMNGVGGALTARPGFGILYAGAMNPADYLFRVGENNEAAAGDYRFSVMGNGTARITSDGSSAYYEFYNNTPTLIGKMGWDSNGYRRDETGAYHFLHYTSKAAATGGYREAAYTGPAWAFRPSAAWGANQWLIEVQNDAVSTWRVDGPGNVEQLMADDTATIGPKLSLVRVSASPADNDILGGVLFIGRTEAPAADAAYGQIQAAIIDATVASLAGRLDFGGYAGGALNKWLSVYGLDGTATATGVVFESLLAASTTKAQFTFKLDDAGAVEGPTIALYRKSASPADNDKIGVINFDCDNSDGSQARVTMAQIAAKLDGAPTEASEDCELYFRVMHTGTMTDGMLLDSSANLHLVTNATVNDPVTPAYDDHDDAMVLREMYSPEVRERNIARLREIGILNDRNMLGVQPMFALLAGGTYQNRARIDQLAEQFLAENAELRRENAELRGRVESLEARA